MVVSTPRRKVNMRLSELGASLIVEHWLIEKTTRFKADIVCKGDGGQNEQSIWPFIWERGAH